MTRWNGVSKRFVQIGAAAGALTAMIILASQLGISALIGPALGLDARYALAADVREIQVDVLALRRDTVNREYLEFQREAARRPLTHLEREHVETLQRILRQIDQRLQKIGRTPDN